MFCLGVPIALATRSIAGIITKTIQIVERLTARMGMKGRESRVQS